MELKIKEEFENLTRPLTEEKYNLLEENIKTNGCCEPIVILEDHTIIGIIVMKLLIKLKKY